MKLLAVDTATMTRSVALLENGQVISEKTCVAQETHSKQLHETIGDVLAMAGTSLESVDALAVTTGPGSFTGLRIGVSAVKGLAFALNKPVAAVSTLEALSYPFRFSSMAICPVIDARRGEVYTATYRYLDDALTLIGPERLTVPEDIGNDMDGPVIFTGSGASAYRDIIGRRLGSLAHFAPPPLTLIRGSIVGFLGYERLQKRGGDPVESLAPLYIRKSDAELNFRK